MGLMWRGWWWDVVDGVDGVDGWWLVWSSLPCWANGISETILVVPRAPHWHRQFDRGVQKANVVGYEPQMQFLLADTFIHDGLAGLHKVRHQMPSMLKLLNHYPCARGYWSESGVVFFPCMAMICKHPMMWCEKIQEVGSGLVIHPRGLYFDWEEEDSRNSFSENEDWGAGIALSMGLLRKNRVLKVIPFHPSYSPPKGPRAFLCLWWQRSHYTMLHTLISVNAAYSHFKLHSLYLQMKNCLSFCKLSISVCLVSTEWSAWTLGFALNTTHDERIKVWSKFSTNSVIFRRWYSHHITDTMILSDWETCPVMTQKFSLKSWSSRGVQRPSGQNGRSILTGWSPDVSSDRQPAFSFVSEGLFQVLHWIGRKVKLQKIIQGPRLRRESGSHVNECPGLVGEGGPASRCFFWEKGEVTIRWT